MKRCQVQVYLGFTLVAIVLLRERLTTYNTSSVIKVRAYFLTSYDE